MNKARIVSNNAAIRATITASSEASTSMSATNLLLEGKGEIYRSVGTSATLTLTWDEPEQIAGFFLTPCNFTQQVTMRGKGFAQAADVNPLFDTGATPACPWPAPVELDANSWPYGGGNRGRVWVAVPGSVQKLVIEINDPTNPAGFLEAAMIACGASWSPEYNTDWEASLTALDSTSNYRDGAHDLRSDVGFISDELEFSLSYLGPDDTFAFWNILRKNGLSRPLWVSLHPDDPDPRREWMYQLYCKFASKGRLTRQRGGRQSTKVSLAAI